MMHVQLPDRKEITLREAVTAFVYGESRAASSGSLYPGFTSDALLEQLHGAAHAGRVRFRALKPGINEYQEIDPSYFSTRRYFDWDKNQIHYWAPCDDGEYEGEYEGEYDQVLVLQWYDVHLDREGFASLLEDMGVSVQQSPDPQGPGPDVPGKRKTYSTGAAGRPTSKHLVLKLAQRRLDAGEYPEQLSTFSEQLAAELLATEPDAAPMTAKTVGNVIRELWRTRPRSRPK